MAWAVTSSRGTRNAPPVAAAALASVVEVAAEESQAVWQDLLTVDHE